MPKRDINPHFQSIKLFLAPGSLLTDAGTKEITAEWEVPFFGNIVTYGGSMTITPVPLPTAFVSLGSGLFIVGLYRKYIL